MKTIHKQSTLFLTALLVASSFILNAQAPLSSPVQDVRYEFISDDGTNASAVVWIPEYQMYVTAIAGNAEFPLEGFNSKGQNVFSLTAGADLRGLWYNPATKQLEGNGAGDYGWFSYTFGADNKPSAPYLIHSGQNQPDFQSVGTLYTKKKQVAFLNSPNTEILLFSRNTPSKIKSIPLEWDGTTAVNINLYSLGYTGHKGYEFVFLDYINGRLVFHNTKGKQTATVNLPAGAPLNDVFAFSYTNERVFLYDKEARVWYGYKVF